MNQDIKLHHIALHGNNRERTLLFYTKILGMTLSKTFFLSNRLSKEIFDVDEKIEVLAFQKNEMYFEIFLLSNSNLPSCHHVGLHVENLEEFLSHCQKYDVKPYSVKKKEKTLWFIKDFFGNIFEIKQ